MPDTETSVKNVQLALNRFTAKWLKGVTPLVVDGKKGKATNSRILAVRYYLGWGINRTSTVDRALLGLMNNPHRRASDYPAPQMRRTGMLRRARQKVRWAEQLFRATVAPNVTRFDGVPCAIWIAKELHRIRGAGMWKGRLVSGWRSPAYSKSLCIRMCGAPTCPGRCAGASSNHSGSVKPAGACDVSDYERFEAEAIRLKSPLINRLDARDPVHFSVNGR